MNDDQQFLASAYLDGELTSEERARAEADPEVMAAVERLREVRQALAVVEPPDPARRDEAIDAALRAFDEEREDVAPPPAIPFQRRRASGWLISAAAAALVLVVAGGILAVRGGGDDDGGDDTAGGGLAADTSVGVLAESGEQDQAQSPAAGTEARRSAAEDEATTETTAVAAAPTVASADTATERTEASQADSRVVRSRNDLTALAAERLELGFDLASEPRADCDEGRFLGEAIYLENGVETSVEVFLVRRAGEVRAVEPTTCDVIARAPAP
jgi:hypothetical protein